MASKFLVWLRETGKLYARYMAVGAASVPFAVAYAMAKQAGWNEKISLPVLAVFGLTAAFFVWKAIEKLPTPTFVVVVEGASEAEWIDFLKAGSAVVPVHAQQFSTACVSWKEAMPFIVSGGDEAMKSQVFFADPNLPFEELLTGLKAARHSRPNKVNVPAEPKAQTTPLSSFLQGRQISISSGLQGLE